ncbi:MAG: CPBP family intramembrane metalloprotease [Phycisphaerales bacterium]|nr:CPBP family intramembrane metalloprotease [Phycisphaerales bacterium]
MAGERATNSGTRSRGESYWELSKRPLHVLLFLLPLILLYEVGSMRYLADQSKGVVETIVAHRLLYRLFESFGGAAFYLPGMALVAVLAVWHLLLKDRWNVRLTALVGMAAESAVLTMPLLILGMVTQRQAAISATTQLAGLSTEAKVTLAVGAGLYEELLFRLVIITGLHLVLVDVARMKNVPGSMLAAAVSAGAFAWYHDVPGLPMGLPLATFYVLSGLYFAGLFIVRGFGIVVAVHALYDIVALTMMSGNRN